MGAYRHACAIILAIVCSGIFEPKSVSAAPPVLPSSYSVVLLSLKDQHSADAWPEAEVRVRDELEISGISPVVLSESAPDGQRIEDWFANIAERTGAASVLMIRKLDEQRAVISTTTTTDEETRALTFKEIQIDINHLSSPGEAADVVALKAMEAIRAAKIVIPDDDSQMASPKTTDTENSSRPVLTIKQSAWIVLTTGALSAVTGGALHLAGYSKWSNAEDIRNNRSNDRSTLDYSIAYNHYNDQKSAIEKIKIGMIATYATGGVLMITGAVMLTVLKVKSKKRSRVGWSPSGYGFAVTF